MTNITDSKIPKRIFYVWVGSDPIRPNIEFCINSWKSNLSDYEIIQIDENSDNYFNFEKELKNNKWFRTVYERKMYAYISDYIRIKILYDHGGIYLDTDVTVIKSFDSFLKEPLFVGLQSDKNYKSKADIFEPAILGAQKNNKFLKQIIDFYDKAIWEMPIYRMPQIFEYFMLLKHPDFTNTQKTQQKITKYNDITIYPEKYFIPFRYNEKFSTKCIEKDTYTIHWFNASWCKPEISFFLENKHKIPVDKIDGAYYESCRKYEETVINNTFIENIFSIKNSRNKKFKIVTCLYIQMKFKRKQHG